MSLFPEAHVLSFIAPNRSIIKQESIDIVLFLIYPFTFSKLTIIA